MGKSKRKGFEGFCELPVLVPKECVPLLTKLKEKIAGCAHDQQKAKGFIILTALRLMDQQTPHGFWWRADCQVIPCDPPEDARRKGRHLHLVQPLTQSPQEQEKGA